MQPNQQIQPNPNPSSNVNPASVNVNQTPQAPNTPNSPAPEKPKVKTNPNSSQNTLQIAEIRDGIVILNDGSFRAVVMVKSINFDLMSTQELLVVLAKGTA